MKYNILILALLVGFVTLFTSCEEEKVKPTLTKAIAPELLTPDGTLTYVLTKENSVNPFETFVYTAANYGLEIAPGYTVEMDVEGGDFSAPIDMQGSTSELFQTITIKDFNTKLKGLNYVPEVAAKVQVRIRASHPNSDVQALFSNVITLNVTPYDATFPPIYAVGDAVNGWDPSKGVELKALTEDSFEGLVTLNADAGDPTFRFLGQNTGWGPVSIQFSDFEKVESTPADVFIEDINGYGDSNFKILESGTYKISIDLGRKTFYAEKQ